ncbi:hypothetical protein ACHQM5_014841 [Ranunculus cassubicifolius]
MTILTEHVNHPFHPHTLTSECKDTPYKCNGCKEIGWGLRYRCDECNYDLHKDCAFADMMKSDVSFYQNCTFRLHQRGFVGSCCKACGNSTQGFVYYCPAKQCYLHPGCASLPPILQGEKVELHLREYVTSRCMRCDGLNLWGQSRGWSYRSSCKNYNVHVSCMKYAVKRKVEDKWEKHICKGESSGTLDAEVFELVDIGPEDTSLWRRKRKSSWKIIAAIFLNLVISTILGNPFAVIEFFGCIFS